MKNAKVKELIIATILSGLVFFTLYYACNSYLSGAWAGMIISNICRIAYKED